MSRSALVAGLRRLRLPALASLKRPPRPPLAVTAAVTLALVLGPALALWRLPRPRAEGLGRLLAQAALLQSFPAAPARPVPQLWRQRLGEATAERLWRQQRPLWWQFWGRQGDGGPYLVLPLPRPMLTGALARPPHSVQVDDLLVVAADPLSHRLLTDQLQTLPRQRRGLERRCQQRLETEQAAFWSPAAFGAMVGPLAPLLQSFQEGCVSLELQGDQLRASGEAAASSALLAAAPEGDAAPQAAGTIPPWPAGSLLTLQGRSLEVLLEGLLNRQLIRDPLLSRYGVDDAALLRLRSTPFRLGVRAVGEGPFQAAITLQLAPTGEQRQAWAEVLGRLGPVLEGEGLEPVPAAAGAAPGGSDTLPTSLWRRQNGAVVGGWRWLNRPGGAPELLLFLGPAPGSEPGPALAQGAAAPLLSLGLRPRQLGALGLLPASLPGPLLQAEALELEAQRPADQARAISRLWARLLLTPAAPPSQAPPASPSPPPPPRPAPPGR